MLARGTYLVFFDVDGSYWVVKQVSRDSRITHEELVVDVIYCVPYEMCMGLNGSVRIAAVDMDYYMFMYIPLGSAVVRVYSGKLVPHKGSFVFIRGLRPHEVAKKLSSDGEEVLFREQFLAVLAHVGEVEKKCSDTIRAVLESYKDVIKYTKDVAISVSRYTSETLGFVARPESIIAAETLVATSGLAPPPPPPQPPTPPQPPQPKGLFARLLEKLSSVFRRRKAGGG